jgi:hypothetical protein
MADEKIYVGSGVSKFDGDIVEFSVDLSNPGIKEHMFVIDGKSYIKLKVCAKKDGVDQYGKSHYVMIDTWKPDPAKKESPAEAEGMPF